MSGRRDRGRLQFGRKSMAGSAQTGALVTLTGQIGATSVRRLARVFDSDDGPLTVVISSVGGDVDSAMAMHEMMRLRCDSGRVVTTIGLGAVMSAAVLLLAAGSKGHRYLSRYSRLMYHESWTAAEGGLSDLRTTIRALEVYDRDFDGLIALYTGRKLKEVRALYADGDRWLGATEARAFGFVDHLL